MEILQSTDYDNFILINGNRTVSTKKVERLKYDATNGLNLFPYCPIIVNRDNDKFYIIDGQHRFEASKAINGPIYYVVAEHLSIREIAKLNSNTDKWKPKDFMDCYIKLGMEDYGVLKEFIKSHGLPLRIALALLMNGYPDTSSRDTNIFMDGNFKVNHFEKATNFIGLVDRLMGNYTFFRDRNLLNAIYKLDKIGKWDIDTMEAKIKARPHMMDKQSTPKTYMYLLQQIYNVGNHNHRNIL